ncbi:ParB N-terminal domain-containing protein [Humitalea sp. 24SJ18S-53]|uniref:ParB N-terminal domain-containing protein n=1 Tax=Humitalea sp. 24SJ18S-53 TaxID=3422307 RepID=UPI003D66857B
MSDHTTPMRTPPKPLPDLDKVKPRSVAVSSLVLDPAMQPRAGTDRETVRRYQGYMKADPKTLPPITAAKLTDEPEGQLYVIDGFHRVAAAQGAGLRTLLAKTVEVDRETAEWMAVVGNRAHGLPLGRKTDRAAFRRYVEAGRNVDEAGGLKPYRAIVQDLENTRGRSTVHRWMNEMFPSLAAEMAGREEPEAEDGKPDLPASAVEQEEHLAEITASFGRLAQAMHKQQVRAIGHHAATEGWTRAEVERRATERTRAVVRQSAFEVWAGAASLLGTTPEALQQEHEAWLEEHEASSLEADY